MASGMWAAVAVAACLVGCGGGDGAGLFGGAQGGGSGLAAEVTDAGSSAGGAGTGGAQQASGGVVSGGGTGTGGSVTVPTDGGLGAGGMAISSGGAVGAGGAISGSGGMAADAGPIQSCPPTMGDWLLVTIEPGHCLWAGSTTWSSAPVYWQVSPSADLCTVRNGNYFGIHVGPFDAPKTIAVVTTFGSILQCSDDPNDPVCGSTCYRMRAGLTPP